MDEFWALFVVPIIVQVIGLVIEYWVIQPRTTKSNRPDSARQSASRVYSDDENVRDRDLSAIDIYEYIFVGLTSGTASISAALLLTLFITDFTFSEGIFVFTLAPALIGGLFLAFLAEIKLHAQEPLVKRLPIAMVLGFIGGLFGLLISCIVIVILFLWAGSKVRIPPPG